MPSEAYDDRGLLSPLSQGADALVSDDAVLTALVTVEVALARAWAIVDGRPSAELERVFGWRGPGEECADPGIDLDEIAAAARRGGNPVIPLVTAMRARVGPGHAAAVHRGATSQDILDSALVFVARRACRGITGDLVALEAQLGEIAERHRDTVTAARTLTQHAVPTTVGVRVASWLRGVRRARRRLEEAAARLPAQLAGAGGTLASFVAVAGDRARATELPRVFAAELGLAAPDAPWHTERWPITELGDALVQVADALGVFASDIANGARTEIGEWVVAEPGGSSAMPQKRNPTPAVLIRSGSVRAPHLGATLHSAAALAVDERPDGAWHAEWPALRELLRLVSGSAATARRLADGLTVDPDAVARNLRRTGAALVAERLSLTLTPILGSHVVGEIIARAGEGEDVAPALQEALQRASDREGRSQFPAGGVEGLLDPARYTGLAAEIVDRTLEDES